MKKELKIDLSEGIKRLNIMTNKLVNSKFVGGYQSVFKGRGLEFLDYRTYSSGDDASLIDWKASLRSNNLLIKEFAEERNLSVFFLIDASSSMIYGSIDKLKMEYAAELVATLSYAILHAGDSIGFAFFNDKIIKSEPPSIGFKQYYKFMKCLVDPNQYGGNCDLSQALKFLISYLKEYSIVIIVSDFIGLKENWQSYVRIISKKYDLIGIMIRDPRDENLPEYNGQVVFSDIFSARQLIVNVNLVRENYAKYVALQEQEIEKAFIDSKSDFIKLTTDRPFIKPISDLFLRRANRHR